MEGDVPVVSRCVCLILMPVPVVSRGQQFTAQATGGAAVTIEYVV